MMRSFAEKYPPLWPQCLLRVLRGFEPKSGRFKRPIDDIKAWLFNHREHRGGTEKGCEELSVSLGSLRLCVLTLPLLIGALFFFSPPLSSQDLPSDSSIAEQGPLVEHLKSAAEENPSLVAAFREYHRALQKVPQVDALPDPELSFGYFVSPVETRVGPQIANFSLKQMFPWRGTLDRRGEAAASKAKAEYEAFVAEKARLFEKVRRSWYELYLQQADIRSVRNSLETLQSMEAISETRYMTGRRSRVDHLRIRIQRRQMEERLERLEDGMEPIRARFRELVGEDAGTGPELPDTLLRQELSIEKEEALKDSILARDPRREELRHLVEASQAEKEAARKEGMPSIGLGVNYTIVGERSGQDIPDNGKDVLMPMLSMRLPIYREKYRAKEREAEYQKQRFERSEEDRENRLKTMIEESFYELEDAERRIELYRAQVDDAEQARSILLDAFRTGDSDVDELLKMERTLYVYRFELERARVDRNKAVARFKKMLLR